MSAEVQMLRRAVDYALTAVDTVTSDLLSQPTPCSKWNLRMLLSHACESVAALQEGLTRGRVDLFPTDDNNTAPDPTRCLRAGLIRLRDEWTGTSDSRIIAVADHRIPQSLVAAAAALEIGVHGWDVFRASGHDRPIPPDLAAELLAISPLLIPAGNRHRLFAPPVRTSTTDNAGEQLVAYLGRSPAAEHPTRKDTPRP
jgi:uncharacterized protein (TIGR03086 family)